MKENILLTEQMNVFQNVAIGNCMNIPIYAMINVLY